MVVKAKACEEEVGLGARHGNLGQTRLTFSLLLLCRQLYNYVPVSNYCNVFIFYELFYLLFFYKYLFYISVIY